MDNKIGLEKFKSQKPDVEQLRIDNSELSDLLVGEFESKPIIEGLPNGENICWVLNQGKGDKNPTYEALPTGTFGFICPYEVTMTFLGNTTINVKIGNNPRVSVSEKIRGPKWDEKGELHTEIIEGRTIIVPPNTHAEIDAPYKPVCFICQYK